MIKDALVLLTGSPTDASALETAFLLARVFGTTMDCLHVRPGTGQIIARAAVDQFTATTGNMDLIHSIERAAAQASKEARQSFDGFCDYRNFGGKDGFERDGVSVSFREILGDDVKKSIQESRFNDLTFLARGSRNGGFSASDLGSIVISAGRPIVLAPSEAPENLAPTVAIAWKDTAEAARAVGAAIPVLRKADRVFVLAGDEGGDAGVEGMESAEKLAGHLRRHGISVETRSVLAAGRTLPEAILETAGSLRANLLVSGAYGHSRASELVFGGFTRHVIKEARLPVFLFH